MARKATPKKPALCLCGCETPVAPKRSFRQGHDQRLRGMLQKGTAPKTAGVRAFAASENARKRNAKATEVVLDAITAEFAGEETPAS